MRKGDRRWHSTRLASLVLFRPSSSTHHPQTLPQRATSLFGDPRKAFGAPFAPGDRSVFRGCSEGRGKVAQGLERFAGRAGFDRLTGAGDSVSEIRSETGGFEGSGGVEENHIAAGPTFGAGEDGFENGGVALRGVSALEMAEGTLRVKTPACSP